MLVVADTTPIITLLKIGRLDLLQIIYKEITIPNAVYAELTENLLFEKEAVEVKNCSFINVSPVQDSEKVNFIQATSGLDLGESESLVLCKELNADLLLMDEARGRLIAKQLGIPLTGSVGLLAAAFKLHIITPQELKSYVEIIKNSGRFIAKNLLQGLLDLIDR